MHAIQPKQSHDADKCTPNILPCRINHNGPVNASKRYWAPEVDPGMRCHVHVAREAEC